MKKTIACDVDLTVVASDRAHWEWLCTKAGIPRGAGMFDSTLKDEGGAFPYNLGEVFGMPLAAMDFWRQEDLYDALEPMPGSVEVLRELSARFDIVFATTIKGNHHKSKCYFLKNHFPFLDGICATKEKKFVRCDYLIEDRLNVLECMPQSVVTVQMATPYKQSSEFTPDYIVKNWKEVREVFKSL